MEAPKPIEETGYPNNSSEHDLLFQTIDKKGKGLASIVHTSEKSQIRYKKSKQLLNRILDKVDLDRNTTL